MFNKVLVANRGEISVRILRALKDLDIRSVLIYSEADKDSIGLKMADESVCIGPAPAMQSYLNIANIISAAVITNSEAIHPGYGFLAENKKFADICSLHDLKFIGPSPETLKKMADKNEARQLAMRVGIPVASGSGVLTDLKHAIKIADRIGYPLLLKAVGGGGGKGIRIINNSKELEKNFYQAQEEARISFSDDRLYIEKYIQHPRHIEMQIVRDIYGNCVYLGERNCSIQRRYQKLIEESPALISDKLRHTLGKMSCKLADELDYEGVGTVEFLVDSKEEFYFMEMNTRIQVEHPVTELITNFDLVKEQIRIAAGEKLSISQEDINFKEAAAIEFRINAENWKSFLPSTGTITNLYLPGGPGVRVDTHIYTGYTIKPFYDSLLAKIIVRGANRKEALYRAKRALSELVIEGVDTNKDLHELILQDKYFIEGNYTTDFINHLVIK